MPFKEKVQVVTISVVIALAAAAGLYQFVQPRGPHALGPGDDAPIIIAGGSLLIGTSDVLTFNPDPSKPQLNYSSPMQVFQIDVFHVSGGGSEVSNSANVTAGAPGTVVMNYCKNQNCSGPSDTVTLHWDANKNVWIDNSLSTIQKSSRLLPNLRIHSRKKWMLVNVSVNGGTAVDCGTGNQDDCTIVVHTCIGGNGVTCTAKY